MDRAGVWEEQAVSKATRSVPSARAGCSEGTPKGLGSWLPARGHCCHPGHRWDLPLKPDLSPRAGPWEWMENMKRRFQNKEDRGGRAEAKQRV